MSLVLDRGKTITPGNAVYALHHHLYIHPSTVGGHNRHFTWTTRAADNSLAVHIWFIQTS